MSAALADIGRRGESQAAGLFPQALNGVLLAQTPSEH